MLKREHIIAVQSDGYLVGENAMSPEVLARPQLAQTGGIVRLRPISGQAKTFGHLNPDATIKDTGKPGRDWLRPNDIAVPRDRLRTPKDRRDQDAVHARRSEIPAALRSTRHPFGAML